MTIRLQRLVRYRANRSWQTSLRAISGFGLSLCEDEIIKALRLESLPEVDLLIQFRPECRSPLCPISGQVSVRRFALLVH